jgi:hypothetical protein
VDNTVGTKTNQHHQCLKEPKMLFFHPRNLWTTENKSYNVRLENDKTYDTLAMLKMSSTSKGNQTLSFGNEGPLQN